MNINPKSWREKLISRLPMGSFFWLQKGALTPSPLAPLSSTAQPHKGKPSPLIPPTSLMPMASAPPVSPISGKPTATTSPAPTPAPLLSPKTRLAKPSPLSSPTSIHGALLNHSPPPTHSLYLRNQTPHLQSSHQQETLLQ